MNELGPNELDPNELDPDELRQHADELVVELGAPRDLSSAHQRNIDCHLLRDAPCAAG